MLSRTEAHKLVYHLPLLALSQVLKGPGNGAVECYDRHQRVPEPFCLSPSLQTALHVSWPTTQQWLLNLHLNLLSCSNGTPQPGQLT